MEKTNNHDMFIFREDNRARIDQAHVRKIKDSISSRNMLELKPISVNSQMEIIDGQHRLLAAKDLGLPVYYTVEHTLRPEDIVLLNINKSWTNDDFFNYYCKNGNEEYLKLKNFLQENNIPLKVALSLSLGMIHSSHHDFKIGKYKFELKGKKKDIDICWETIEFIKKMNGYSAYTRSGKFWKALIKLVTHHHFEEEIWKKNLHRMIEKMRPCTNTDAYLECFMQIYNWKNHDKIEDLKD